VEKRHIMGLIRKLSFWKKHRSSDVEIFEPPATDNAIVGPGAEEDEGSTEASRSPQAVVDLTGDDEEDGSPRGGREPSMAAISLALKAFPAEHVAPPLRALPASLPPLPQRSRKIGATMSMPRQPQTSAYDTSPTPPRAAQNWTTQTQSAAHLPVALGEARARRPLSPACEADEVEILSSRRATSSGAALSFAAVDRLPDSPTPPLQQRNDLLALAVQPHRSLLAPGPIEAHGEALCFDVPLEEIYARVGEAFGPTISASLQAQKWDKRAQALTALKSLLRASETPNQKNAASRRGPAFRDRLTSWRISCLVLNRCMCDKVMPVRLAALELFQVTFTDVKSVVPKNEVVHALDTLMEHILERLGDSNLRLHEGARSCVYFAAEHPGLLGLGTILAKLRAQLGRAGRGREKAKIHFGILDSVNFLLNNFPGRRSSEASPQDAQRCCDEPVIDEEDFGTHNPEDFWTEEDVAPFIFAGMDDVLGARVRGCAVTLAVTAFLTLGMEPMRPVLAELRPAKQALLKQRFLEAEGLDFIEDGEDVGEGGDDEDLQGVDLGSLVVCGSAIRPPPRFPITPPLPGCVECDGDTEFLMDGILEETGAVFSGTGIVNEVRRRGRTGSAVRLPVSFLEAQLGGGLGLDDEDERLLEQELLSLGLADDCVGIEAQQAIYASFQEEQDRSYGSHSLSVY